MKSFDVKKVGVTAGIVLLSCVIILGGGGVNSLPMKRDKISRLPL